MIQPLRRKCDQAQSLAFTRVPLMRSGVAYCERDGRQKETDDGGATVLPYGDCPEPAASVGARR